MLLIRRFQKFDIYLFFILILSAILNIYNIWEDDTVNAYYTAAVTSMMQSWHHFFFASFDPAGYVTVDKPRSPSGCKRSVPKFLVCMDGASSCLKL